MGAATRNTDQRDFEAAEWCISLAEGELSPAEQADFDAWVLEEDNGVALERAARVWRAAGQSVDLPEILHLRSEALTRLRAVQRKRWRAPRTFAWAGGGLVAVACALIAAVFLFHTPTRVYRTDVGERQVAMLADGSRLSLDADTEVRVRLSQDRRDLTLTRGRAKFDVARDPLRPFAVLAGGKVVVATGTSFSVELFDREARVLLYEGHVAVMDQPARSAGRSGERPAEAMPFAGLEPGRELVVALDKPISRPQIEAVEPARSLSWEGGRLNFEDEPLASAVQRINRYSPRQVVLSDPSLNTFVVNGVFAADDVEAFLEAVTTFNPIEAVEGDNGVTLRPS
ncbi:FecR family protein [Brevundimonas sp.]